MIEMIVEAFPLLLLGAKNTLIVSIVSMIISIPLGVVFGLMRLSNISAVKGFAMIYIEIWRAVPLIVELLVLFFILPELIKAVFKVTVNIRAFDTMVVGCVVWTSANLAEVVRGAIQAISFGQTESAMSLGMSYFQRMRLVIMPQAVKMALSPTIGVFTLMLKGTSLGFIIEYRELVRMAQFTIERQIVTGPNYVSILIYSVVLVFYFAMCYPLSQYSIYLERKFSKGVQ